jgi:uncharacterized membrane protein YedE/YeeE
MKRPVLPIIVALAIVAALGYAVWSISAPDANSRALAFSLALGAVFGAVLQRSRFCFFCHSRDLLENGDPRGMLAILLALAVGAIGYLVIFGAWLPVPMPERLPPTAHVGPVSPVLAVGAFVFGIGMAVSGSCISAHLYRLGEGSPTAPFALVGTVAGFVLGFVTWNPLYLAFVAGSPVIWLPHQVGYAGMVTLTFVALAGLAYFTIRASRLKLKARDGGKLDLDRVLCSIFVNRWPAYVGGLAVGVISAVAYFRVAPLGVTAELGSLARTAAADAGLLPSTLHGLDSFRGCVTVVKQALFSNNGLFVAGLVLASFVTAIVAGEFKPRMPRADEIWRGLVGGVLLGWGAMVALGCTVGVLLSGINAGALSGWIFLVFCFAGVAGGLWARKRFAF